MKNQRQKLIIQLVTDENISTQEDLRDALERHGLKVTQATVSRDIRELSLVKTIGNDGNYKYSTPALKKEQLGQNGNMIFGIISEAVVSVDYALNTVAVKCHTGMAQAVCAKLDNLGLENVVGTLAGDDTIFMLMRTEKAASDMTDTLKKIIIPTSQESDE